jgi:hypothetical protein
VPEENHRPAAGHGFEKKTNEMFKIVNMPQ